MLRTGIPFYKAEKSADKSKTKLNGYDLKSAADPNYGKLEAIRYGFAIGCDWVAGQERKRHYRYDIQEIRNREIP